MFTNDGNGTGMYMPVAPMGNYYGNNGGGWGNGFGGNDGWGIHSNGYDGRSGHSINDRMVDNIERMYDNAGTEHERAEIQDVINYIRRKGMNA